MKVLWLSLLLCLVAFPLNAQTKEELAELEEFREKLRIYLEKFPYSGPNGGEGPMVHKPATDKYRMPTGNVTSYMEDPETGIQKEYKTGMITHPDFPFIYDPESGKIYDSEKGKYYDFKGNKKTGI